MTSSNGANQRGQYGAPAPAGEEKSAGKTGLGIAIMAALTVGVYALSPGARHYYKHGRLPPHPG